MAQNSPKPPAFNPEAYVPGQDDAFNLLAQIFGMQEEGIQNNRGRELGLTIPRGSIHHAMNAEDFTRRQGGFGLPIAALLAQLGGLGVEGVEYGMNPSTIQTSVGLQDTLNDLLANAMGAATGSLPQHLAPAGREATNQMFKAKDMLTAALTPFLERQFGPQASVPAAPAAPQPLGGMTSQDPMGTYAQLWKMLNQR